jgi:hypothetical protein
LCAASAPPQNLGHDHDALGVGAIYNYMYGIGPDQDVRMWFDMPVPKTRVNRPYIERARAVVQAPSSVH